MDDPNFEQDEGKSHGGSSAVYKRTSLSRIILSMESNVAKQLALQHVLTALQVIQAREILVAALSNHSINITLRDTILPDTPGEDLEGNDPLLQIAHGGGEAPANAAEAMISVKIKLVDYGKLIIFVYNSEHNSSNSWK